MSISSKEQFEAMLLDVLQAYEVTPRFDNTLAAKSLGRHHLAATISNMLVDIENGNAIAPEEAKQRVEDSWNGLVKRREAEVSDLIAGELAKLQAAQQQFHAAQQQFHAARAAAQHPGGTWQRYEEPQKPPH